MSEREEGPRLGIRPELGILERTDRSERSDLVRSDFEGDDRPDLVGEYFSAALLGEPEPAASQSRIQPDISR